MKRFLWTILLSGLVSHLSMALCHAEEIDWSASSEPQGTVIDWSLGTKAGCPCGGAGACECGPFCTCKPTTYRSSMADTGFEQPKPAPKTGAVQGFPAWEYCEGGWKHTESGWCKSSEHGLYFLPSTPGVFYTWDAMQKKCSDDCAAACQSNGNGGCGTTGYGAYYGNGGGYQGKMGLFGGGGLFKGGRFGGGGGCGKGG